MVRCSNASSGSPSKDRHRSEPWMKEMLQGSTPPPTPPVPTLLSRTGRALPEAGWVPIPSHPVPAGLSSPVFFTLVPRGLQLRGAQVDSVCSQMTNSLPAPPAQVEMGPHKVRPRGRGPSPTLPHQEGVLSSGAALGSLTLLYSAPWSAELWPRCPAPSSPSLSQPAAVVSGLSCHWEHSQTGPSPIMRQASDTQFRAPRPSDAGIHPSV